MRGFMADPASLVHHAHHKLGASSCAIVPPRPRACECMPSRGAESVCNALHGAAAGILTKRRSHRPPGGGTAARRGLHCGSLCLAERAEHVGRLVEALGHGAAQRRGGVGGASCRRVPPPLARPQLHHRCVSVRARRAHSELKELKGLPEQARGCGRCVATLLRAEPRSTRCCACDAPDGLRHGPSD